MKMTELADKLIALENKLSALGDIQTKSGEVETLLQRIRETAAQIDQDKQTTTQLKADTQSAKEEIDKLIESIQNAKFIADEYSSVVDKNNKQVGELIKKLSKSSQNSNSLETIIRDQLGLVNAGILSNSFKVEAEKLEKAVNNRFWWLLAVTIILFVVAGILVFWELATSNNFWSTNFVIKLTLTTPVVFYLVFITKAYNRDKRLYDEYTFKSTVALSFEAYRKLIKEDGAQSADQTKVIDFLISSISNLYTSPMENIHKQYIKDEDVDIDILGKIADVFKKFIK